MDMHVPALKHARRAGSARGFDLLVRLAGLVGLALGYGCITLLRRPGLTGGGQALQLGLAALAFVGISAGLAAIVLGRHLVDRVPVARPWRAV